MRRFVAICAVAITVLSGCSLLGFLPNQRPAPTPQPAQIEVSNGTTLDLTLFVNGSEVASIPGGGATTLQPGQLPPLPWSVEARSTTGRVVGSFPVQESDLLPNMSTGGATTWKIPGDRVDLSCGVLVMWVGGNAIGGPAPGPGTPGDCQP